MTGQLSPTPVFKSWDNNGQPLQGGQLFSYVAGSNTPQATYTDSTQGTPNANPVILNARGEANVWLDPTLAYKLILQDSLGNLIWSVDNIQGGISNSFSFLTVGSPVSGPSLTVNSAVGWQAIQATSTVQVIGPHSLTNANQNIGITQLLLHGYAAEIVSINSLGGIDQKVWSNFADSSGNYNYRIENDALNATYTYCQVARTGNSGIFGSHQPIVTWSIGYGNVTIASTINVGTYELAVYGGNVVGFSNGFHIGAGTNTADNALTIVNAANTALFLNIRGDGVTVMGPSTTANAISLSVAGQVGSTGAVATFGGKASNFITVTDGAGMVAVVQAATGNAGIFGTSSADAVQIVTNGTARINLTSAGGIGFFGAAATSQPTTGVAASVFVANAGTAVNDASTFDGYTLKQVVKALRLEGLLA